MLSFKEYLEERNIAWQRSVSRILFGNHLHTSFGEVSFGFVHLPLPNKQIKDIVDQRATVFHAAGVENFGNVIRYQKRKGAISGFFNMDRFTMERGIWAGGGVVFELDSQVLFSSPDDLSSIPDNSGRRWIAMREFANIANDKKVKGIFSSSDWSKYKSFTKDFKKMMFDLVSKYLSDGEEILPGLAEDEWFSFSWALSDARKIGDTSHNEMLSKIVTDFMDKVYKLYRKHKDILTKLISSYLMTRETRNSWDEVVVSDYRIKRIHVLPSVPDMTIDKEIRPVVQRHKIQTKKWDSTSDFKQYVKKTGLKEIEKLKAAKG